MTVTTAIQIWRTVCPTQPRKLAREPKDGAVMIAATGSPVPVASGWKDQTAA
jgi:hypothetical protein